MDAEPSADHGAPRLTAVGGVRQRGEQRLDQRLVLEGVRAVQRAGVRLLGDVGVVDHDVPEGVLCGGVALLCTPGEIVDHIVLCILVQENELAAVDDHERTVSVTVRHRVGSPPGALWVHHADVEQGPPTRRRELVS